MRVCRGCDKVKFRADFELGHWYKSRCSKTRRCLECMGIVNKPVPIPGQDGVDENGNIVPTEAEKRMMEERAAEKAAKEIPAGLNMLLAPLLQNE